MDTNNEDTSTCCTCGYQWTRGTDGSHHCATNLRRQLDEQARQIEELTKERDGLHGVLKYAEQTMREMESERDRLRTALEDVERVGKRSLRYLESINIEQPETEMLTALAKTALTPEPTPEHPAATCKDGLQVENPAAERSAE